MYPALILMLVLRSCVSHTAHEITYNLNQWKTNKKTSSFLSFSAFFEEKKRKSNEAEKLSGVDDHAELVLLGYASALDCDLNDEKWAHSNSGKKRGCVFA